MKLIIRFILTLCVFLLPGYSHLKAHTQQEDREGMSIRQAQDRLKAGFSASQQYRLLTLSQTPSRRSDDHQKIEARSDENKEEEEEDNKDSDDKEEELNPLKKSVKPGTGSVFLLPTQATTPLQVQTKYYYGFFDHFSYTSAHRYIIFRVIRI
jgi:hypothetical protein